MLPSQVSFVPSKLEFGVNSGRVGRLRENVPDRGAVLRRRRVQVIDHAQAACSRHLLRHDGGVAGNVLAPEAGEQASIEVVTATGAVGDRQRYGLALVEILDRIRTGGVRESARQYERQARQERRPTRAIRRTMHQLSPSIPAAKSDIFVGPFPSGHSIKRFRSNKCTNMSS
jgi:hypothetical protein